MAIEVINNTTGFKLVTEASGAARTTLRPNEQGLLGSYRVSNISGSFAFVAGPLMSLRWTSPTAKCVVRGIRARLHIATAVPALAEVALRMNLASAWTLNDGGIIDSPVKKRTTMSASLVPANGIIMAPAASGLSAGTRTLGSNFGFSATSFATGQAGFLDFNYDASDPSKYPVVFDVNEGFVITNGFALGFQARFSYEVDWDEFSSY